MVCECLSFLGLGLAFVGNLIALLHRLRHLLHVVHQLNRLWCVLLEPNLSSLSQSVESVHRLFDLSSFTEVRGLLDCIVNLLRVLVDEDREHFLRVGLLTIFGLSLSVDHNLLRSNSLWLLHHLWLRHSSHWVVQLLHVSVSIDHHLLSNYLLLLRSLIRETLSIEELILNSRLTTVLIHHVGINKNRCSTHDHGL